jgi:hypothetical protein
MVMKETENCVLHNLESQLCAIGCVEISIVGHWMCVDVWMFGFDHLRADEAFDFFQVLEWQVDN